MDADKLSKDEEQEEKDMALATKIASAEPGMDFGDIGAQISQYADLLGKIRKFVPDLEE